MAKNILTDKFYYNLTYVIYNGPPNTIYGKYSGSVITEDGIIKAIETCCDLLFKHIINPSDNVSIAAIKKNKSNFYYLKNPSKSVLKFMIEKDEDVFDKYFDIFTDDEIMELIAINSKIIQYVKVQTYEMSELAVKIKGENIKYVRVQTPELCKLAIKNMFEQNHQYFYDQSLNILQTLTYFDNQIVDMIVCVKYLLHEFDYIPKRFLTEQRIIKAIETNPFVIKFINLTQDLCDYAFDKNYNVFEYVPKEYQTITMIDKIINGKYYKLLRFINCLTQETCNKIFGYDWSNIKYIPNQFQTKDMAMMAVTKDFNNLQYCAHIDRDVLGVIFKSKRDTCKKIRFNFIWHYDEDVLVRIMKVRPGLLKILSAEKQTDLVIRAALNKNGYCLEYVINKTDEYVKLAIENQPRAVMYA